MFSTRFAGATSRPALKDRVSPGPSHPRMWRFPRLSLSPQRPSSSTEQVQIRCLGISCSTTETGYFFHLWILSTVCGCGNIRVTGGTALPISSAGLTQAFPAFLSDILSLPSWASPKSAWSCALCHRSTQAGSSEHCQLFLFLGQSSLFIYLPASFPHSRRTEVIVFFLFFFVIVLNLFCIPTTVSPCSSVPIPSPHLPSILPPCTWDVGVKGSRVQGHP